jgi:hypothetical protein
MRAARRWPALIALLAFLALPQPAVAGDNVDTPGVFRSGTWYLSNSFGGTGEYVFGFGNSSGDRAVVGDWNGDGNDTPGVYRGDMWYLSDGYGGSVDRAFAYGLPGDIPVAGDWNGDGVDSPGVVRGEWWYLSNSFGGSGDYIFKYGISGDIPVVGDWDGNGTDTPGVVRGANWYLSNSFGGNGDYIFVYGNPSDRPVVGDWNADGVDTAGVFRDANWYLNNSHSGGNGDIAFAYGLAGDTPVPGDWAGTAPPPPPPDEPPPPPPPSTENSVRRESVGNRTIYTNSQGRWHISRRCIPRLTGEPNTASVGPGYIFRVDLPGGREIVTPSPPDHPHTGLGVFQADIWRPETGFGAVTGNLCTTETNPIPGSQGRGVVDTGNTEVARSESNFTQTGYLWSHYEVTLADGLGTLFKLQYRYRFYSNLVQVWVNVIQCPTGSCGTGNRPYIKMPRFAMLASGPNVDYTRVACYNPTSSDPLWEAKQLANPRGSTVGNHCNPPSRDYVRIFQGPSTGRDLKIIARSYRTDFVVGGTGSQWEADPNVTPGQGFDRWAYLPLIDGRPRLSNSAEKCPSYPGYTIRDSWDASARNWELVGDDGTHLVYPDGNKGYRWPTKGVFLKAWEDGSNHDGCHTLFNRMGRPTEATENFATYLAIRAE